MNGRFKLLVFDWDGTLMDSEARIIACMQEAARDAGLAVPDRQAVRNIIGLGLEEAVRTLFPRHGKLAPTLVERYRFHFLQANTTPSALFAGAAEVLYALAGEGYFMAVATGKGRQGLDMVLKETGLGPLFHATRTADETFSKPNPEMLFQVMNAVGVEAAETLMIGDSEYDLRMASNARVASLAVSYGVHEPERLLRHRPLGCLDDIGELTGWLRRHGGAVSTGCDAVNLHE
ncbi:MAG: HAD family hydrolase [Candidatus Sedimenticola endophacoides]|nr:MAG: HAD family hydrolase [Candidatus Sedimenticola endophacoides]